MTDIHFESEPKSTFDQRQSRMITLPINGSDLRWQAQPNDDRVSAIKVMLAWFYKDGQLMYHETIDLEILRVKARWGKAPDDKVLIALNAFVSPFTDRIRLAVRDMRTGRMGIKDLRRENQ